MVREYIYEIPKSDVLEHCRDVLVKLDYEIDIYASETDILITKPLKIRRALRRYDYIVFVQVRIELKSLSRRSAVFLSVDQNQQLVEVV